MKLSEYYYNLPKTLIAQHPSEKRDHCRLLTLDRHSGLIEHKIFKDISKLLRKGDLLVLNNTKVIPGRLIGFKDPSMGRLEMLMLSKEPVNGEFWNCLINRRKNLAAGQKIIFKDTASYALIKEVKNDCFLMEFVLEKGLDIKGFMEKFGYAPLPPYIKRDHGNMLEDKEDKIKYQTIFAKHDGSIAAPTAGLHFTDALMAELRTMGVEFTEVTLHVGRGTFMPIKAENIEDHVMGLEYYEVSEASATAINKAKNEDRRVIAVGTTAIRTLETVFKEHKRVEKASGWSGLYITEGYNFGVIDGIITNFHLPESTNLILICAFAGRKQVLDAYNEAVRLKYGFYSYGDACFIFQMPEKTSPFRVRMNPA